MSYAIEFDHVSKRYRLGEFHGSLREAISGWISKLTGRNRPKDEPERWALRDVSFKVNFGEALGIIGPNGAGKTTSLKLATSVTHPTSGRVTLNGRVSALIELGAGFHPDLTGRENIFLNGTILGLRRHEIRERFDEIVEFSELEQFLDTPVKRYSSGMYARLGFAVAAHVKPDVLIIDEVLAVGDAAFVAKCSQRMRDLREAGTTILLVTHSMGMMRRLCDRALLLYDGKIIKQGSPEDVIATYLDTPEYSTNFAVLKESGSAADGAIDRMDDDKPVKITEVKFLDAAGQVVQSCRTGDPLIIQMTYMAQRLIQCPSFEFKIHSLDGSIYANHNSDWEGISVESIQGSGKVEIIIEDIVLPPGTYDFTLAISDSDGLAKYDFHHRRYRFLVMSGRSGTGLISLAHKWNFIAEHTTTGSDLLEHGIERI